MQMTTKSTNLVPNNFALIIGAQKCGTTSLWYYLSEHPQIAISREKEVNFFIYEHLRVQGMSYYRSMWSWQPNNLIALEASPDYTRIPYRPNAAKHIAEVKDAQFKFIYIMRNPLARIESGVTMRRQALEADNLPLPPLEEMEIKKEDIAISQYATQLNPYVEIFGRNKLHLVLLEDLQKNPQQELRRICQFLEIDTNYQFQNLDVIRNNRETLNLNPFVSKLRHKPVIRFLINNLTSPRLRQKLRGRLSRKDKDSFNFKLTEQQKAIILKQLQPDLIQLEAEYGIDVKNKWGLLLD